MKSFCRQLLLLAFVLMLAGCKSTGPTSMPPSVKEDAYRFFGHNDVQIYWVTSSGSFADATFNTVSVTTPSQTAMTLAKIMAKGSMKQVDLAVSGPNSAKVRRVIKDAFTEQTTRLPHLYVLYIGEPAETEELAKMARELNVRFYYIAKMPGVLSGKVPEPEAPVQPATPAP